MQILGNTVFVTRACFEYDVIQHGMIQEGCCRGIAELIRGCQHTGRVLTADVLCGPFTVLEKKGKGEFIIGT
jgi:hypothetical protein